MKCENCHIDMTQVSKNEFLCDMCETRLKIPVKNKPPVKSKKVEVFAILFALADNNVLMLLVLNVIVLLIFELLFVLARVVFHSDTLIGVLDFIFSLSVSIFFFVASYKLGIKKLNP